MGLFKRNGNGVMVSRSRGWYKILVNTEYKYNESVTKESVPADKIITAFWYGRGFSCKMKTVEEKFILKVFEEKVLNPNL